MKYTSILFVAVACLVTQGGPSAHEIPSDVRVQIFVAPQAERVRVVVRAPIAAINELDWPTTGVLLDLMQAEPVLRQAATDWMASRIDIYEEDRRLGQPQLVAVTPSLPSDTSFDSYERAFAHATASPRPATLRSSSARHCSTSSWSTRSGRLARGSRLRHGSTRRACAR